MAAVDSKHPDYAAMIADWLVVRDATLGQSKVKDENLTYLPMPSGFTAEADNGVRAYDGYKTRAQFPEYFAPTVRGMTGIITVVPPVIELPPALEPMIETATLDGLTLEGLHRRIVAEVLTSGRYGLLGDFPPDGGDPYLAGYHAERVINWSSGRDFYVLDESAPVRMGFQWKENKRHRVLRLDEGVYTVTVFDQSEGTDTATGEEVEITKLGAGSLEFIPFTIIGSTDLSPDPDEVPLLQVARAAFAEYRLDADYRHQLYMTGQETLFVSGIAAKDIPEHVGASVIIALPENGKAEYVGPAGVGIEAHERAIAAERMKATQAGAKMFEQESRVAESGDSRRMRFASQTATLTSVAQTSAAGLESALRDLAEWSGAPRESVNVTPNLTFIDVTMDAREAVEMMKLWMGGAISKVTMYEKLQQGEIANPDREFDEEESLIDEHAPDLTSDDALEVEAEEEEDEDDDTEEEEEE